MRDVSSNDDLTRCRVLLWVHIAIALMAGFILLSREDLRLSSIFGGRRIGGANGAVLALPAMWPYLLSLMVSRRVVPQRRSYVAIYSVLLGLGAYASIQVLLATDSLAGITTISIIEAVGFLFGVGLINAYERRIGDA